jgi:hypothetical protein
VVGISRVEFSISAVRSSRESPRTSIAPTLYLFVELKPVGDASGRRVKEPKQAAWGAVVNVGSSLGGHHAALASPVQVTPITV